MNAIIKDIVHKLNYYQSFLPLNKQTQFKEFLIENKNEPQIKINTKNLQPITQSIPIVSLVTQITPTEPMTSTSSTSSTPSTIDSPSTPNLPKAPHSSLASSPVLEHAPIMDNISDYFK